MASMRYATGPQAGRRRSRRRVCRGDAVCRACGATCPGHDPHRRTRQYPGEARDVMSRACEAMADVADTDACRYRPSTCSRATAWATLARRQLTLAGQLAGIQFEREVMELARVAIENNKGTDYERRLIDICNDRDGRLSRMVRSGLELPSDVRQRWEFAVDFRNTAVHEPERLRPRQAVLLLQALREAAHRRANERARSKP